jgi:histidinol-phosphate aminotransferase
MNDARPVPRDCLHGITPYQPGRPIEHVQREFGLKQVVKLASNENPLGPSPKARRALAASAAGAALYPDGSCLALRRALAKRLRLEPDQVLLGNGSSELITQLGAAYLNPGDEVLTSQLTFVTYPTVAKLMDATLVQVPQREFTYDLEAMAQAVTRRTKLVFIANPNNPTGTVVAPEALRRFVDRVPATCLVVLDEAYREYAAPARMADTVAWVREGRPNVVVLRTFSKCHGLAGLRVGYGAAPRQVHWALERVRDPFNVNRSAQAAALAALGDSAHLRRSVALARRERVWLRRQLDALGFVCVPSEANFVFARVPRGDGAECFDALQRRGVIIRPMAGPFVRITAGTRPQNQKLIREVKKIFRCS